MNLMPEIYSGITEEELAEVEKMAGLFFSPEDICIAMDWDQEILSFFLQSVQLRELSDPICKVYFSGRISAEIELRQSIKQAARNGSNPAQVTLLTFQQNSKE